MFRYKILHGFFFPLFGNLSPSGHQIGNDATPGGKNPIYCIHVTKERMDWCAPPSTLAHSCVTTGTGMLSSNTRFSTLKCFLWDTASVLPVYGSCSELRASSKGVYFLPLCINSELLFLLPRHSHATTPNTVVFAENHSCAKSVTVFTFLRKDVLPQMKPHPHYWRTSDTQTTTDHNSGAHGGPRGMTTVGGQWDQKAQLEERSKGMFPSQVPREVFVFGKWKKNLSSLSFAGVAQLCTQPLLWKERKGELEVREQLWAALFVFFLLLLLCPATLEVPHSHHEILISQCPLVCTEWRNWGRIQGVLSCHEEPCASSQPQLLSPAQPPNQLSCHWERGTDKENDPGEVRNTKRHLN